MQKCFKHIPQNSPQMHSQFITCIYSITFVLQLIAEIQQIRPISHSLLLWRKPAHFLEIEPMCLVNQEWYGPSGIIKGQWHAWTPDAGSLMIMKMLLVKVSTCLYGICLSNREEYMVRMYVDLKVCRQWHYAC